MRSLPSFVLVLETGLVLGNPIREGQSSHGAIYDARDLQKQNSVLAAASSCGNTFNLVTSSYPSATPQPIPTDFDYLNFCYSWNQPTKTLTSFSTLPTTITVTKAPSTVTKVTTTTTTTGIGSGATVTCPIPAPSMICGQGGWGYATNNIYSASGIDATACHELCLANAACQSFQVETDSTTTVPTCNLYKVDPSGNNTIVSTSAPFSFFGRDCPDHVPAACGPAGASSIPIQSTSAVIVPSLTRIPPGAFVERDADSVPLPWFLQPFGPVTVSEICSCIYSTPIPATTVMTVVPKPTSVYISVGTTVTAFMTNVVTVSGGTGQAVTSIS